MAVLHQLGVGVKKPVGLRLLCGLNVGNDIIEACLYLLVGMQGQKVGNAADAFVNQAVEPRESGMLAYVALARSHRVEVFNHTIHMPFLLVGYIPAFKLIEHVAGCYRSPLHISWRPKLVVDHHILVID